MYWIYDYPSWIIGPLFVAVFVAVTWIGIFLTRRTVHSWLHRDKRANKMIGDSLANFFVLFGILLGLLAVATYQNYAAVGDIVDKEASSLSALYRDVSAYPQPIRSQLQDGLREYTRYTIEEGWDEQRHGIVPRGGSKLITSVLHLLLTFKASTEREKIIHAETLRQYNTKVEFGRARLSNVTTGLPSVLWWVVAFGSLMNIILIWMQDMEIHVHLILGAVLASILGAVIFLIAELDNPFRGEVSIGPEAIARVYGGVMKPGAGLPVESCTQPCDAGPRTDGTHDSIEALAGAVRLHRFEIQWTDIKAVGKNARNKRRLADVSQARNFIL